MVAGLAALSMGRHLNPALWPRKNKELEEGGGILWIYYMGWFVYNICCDFGSILRRAGQPGYILGAFTTLYMSVSLSLVNSRFQEQCIFFLRCFPVSFQSPLSIYRTPTPSLYLSSSAGKIRYFQTQHLITGARHSSPGLAKLEHLLLSVIGLVIHKTQIQAGRGTSRRITFLVVWPY